MIFYFAIFFIIITIQIIILGIIFSYLELDIEECDISYNVEVPGRFKIKKLKFNIKLYLFKKIKILKIKIYKNYCEIFKFKIHLNVLKKLKDDQQLGIWFVLKNIWKLNPQIKNIKFEIALGTQNTLVTTFLVPIISTAVFSIISKNIKEEDNANSELLSNCKIKIIPKYINTNNLTLIGTLQIYFDTMKTMFFIKKHRKIRV